MIIVGIAGGTVTGKTLLATILKNELKSTNIIQLDNYYKNKPDELDFKNWNFDLPESFDFELLYKNLIELKKIEKSKIPIFDFETNTRSGFQTISTSNYLIIEGIYTLFDTRIREMIDYSIFIESPLDVILARRILRDHFERKREINDIIDRYFKFIKPTYTLSVNKTKKYTNKKINNDLNSNLNHIAKELTSIIKSI